MAREVRCDELPPETLERVIQTLSPHVTAGRLERLERALSTRTRDVVVVLEDIINAHNAAAVLRSAEAFGFFEVHAIVPAGGPFKVSRTIASGAHKWLDLHESRTVDETFGALEARGYTIWVSDLGGETSEVSEIDVSRPVALVFGNERSGASAEAKARAAGRFRVPMYGLVESFNISVAAAISCYDLVSRRRARGIAAGLEPGDARAVFASWLASSVGASREILAKAGLPVPILGGVAAVEIDGTGKLPRSAASQRSG